MTPIKRVLLVSAAMLFLTNCALPSSNAAVRLALIADKTSELNKSLLISLLEVELSQKEGIQLLERAAIDEILSEQKLSAAGLLDRDTAIKLGKLLRADAFLILSLENRAQDANDLIRVRFAETAHGLRLLDY
ncbi:MAG: CsgG/HfaB family protein, partial [Sedimentisphaerales bacterium]